MFPESKVTEIYCMADDFCKEFTLQQEKYMGLHCVWKPGSFPSLPFRSISSGWHEIRAL